MKNVALGFSLALAACGPTSDELRSEPARFSITVQAPWDRVSTCLKAAYLDDFSVVDLPVADQRRTEILLYVAGGLSGNINVAIFEVRGGDAGTTVTWRRRKLLANQETSEATARQRVERCGRAGG